MQIKMEVIINNFYVHCIQYEELAGKDDLMGVEDNAKTKGLVLIFMQMLRELDQNKRSIYRKLFLRINRTLRPKFKLTLYLVFVKERSASQNRILKLSFRLSVCNRLTVTQKSSENHGTNQWLITGCNQFVLMF